jgi:hypothetical protein
MQKKYGDIIGRADANTIVRERSRKQEILSQILETDTRPDRERTKAFFKGRNRGFVFSKSFLDEILAQSRIRDAQYVAILNGSYQHAATVVLAFCNEIPPEKFVEKITADYIISVVGDDPCLLQHAHGVTVNGVGNRKLTDGIDEFVLELLIDSPNGPQNSSAKKAAKKVVKKAAKKADNKAGKKVAKEVENKSAKKSVKDTKKKK